MALLFLSSVTFIIGIISAILFFFRQLNFWTRKGIIIPHLKPIPLFGNTYPIMITRSQSLPEFVQQTYSRFPGSKYFGMMDINKPIVVLRDPELIKEITVKMFDNFPDRRSFIEEDVDPLFGKNILALRGDRWRDMRNTLSPSFTGSKMKFMSKLVSKCSHNFVDYFLEHPEEAKSVDMKDSFTRYTNDVIATTAFGISVDSMKNRDNEFYAKGKDAMDFSSISRVLKIFLVQIFPKLFKLTGEPLMPRATNRFFKKLIQDTVQTRREKNIIRPDMIHLLMEASDSGKDFEISIDDIIAQAFIFFLAGFSTSAALMGFIAHELAMNQEIQEKLRDEVDNVTKQEGGEISYETLTKMKYLDMVISESLRKYPPGVIADRSCVAKYTLPASTPECTKYTIEPGTVVWLPIYALHHDEQYFPDPEKFEPERFNDENKETINPYAYIPFGVGPRKCIGNRFALMETKMLFVHLLQNFVLEPTEKTRHPIVFEKGFNIAADGDFCVRFAKRVP